MLESLRLYVKNSCTVLIHPKVPRAGGVLLWYNTRQIVNRVAKVVRAAFPLTLPILAAYWLIGLGYGLYATRLGLDWWFPLVTAAFVFSGSAEFILATMILGAFHPFAAFTMALLVGSRHIFYGLSMLDRFKGAGWVRKFFIIFLLVDETFALTFRAEPPQGIDRHDFQLAVSVLDWCYWLTGVAVGVFAAHLFANVDFTGIEFIMTAMFAAIFAENWRVEARHAGSILGLVIPTLAVVIFGPDDFMVPAMLGLLAALTLLRRKLQ